MLVNIPQMLFSLCKHRKEFAIFQFFYLMSRRHQKHCVDLLTLFKSQIYQKCKNKSSDHKSIKLRPLDKLKKSMERELYAYFGAIFYFLQSLRKKICFTQKVLLIFYFNVPLASIRSKGASRETRTCWRRYRRAETEEKTQTRQPVAVFSHILLRSSTNSNSSRKKKHPKTLKCEMREWKK